MHGDSEKEIRAVLSEIIDHPETYLDMKKAAARGVEVFSYNDIAKRAIEAAE